MCGLKTNLDVLSEDELDEIAKFKEDCVKKNKTREEHLEDLRKYRREHKDERKQYKKKYNQENKDKKSKWDANYRKKHAEDIAKCREENKERYNEQTKEYYAQKCYDPKENEMCTLSALAKRKMRNSEKYKDVIPTDCIFKSEEEYLQKKLECEKHELEVKKAQREHLLQYKKDYYQKNKERCSENNKKNYEQNKDKYQERKNEYAKTHKKEISAYKREFNARLCYDPKENDYCALSALYSRKHANKEKYKDVIPKNCIVKNE